MVTVVAGDHDSKSEESTAGDFGAPYCSREPLRSTIDIAAVQTAIEYEYRCTECRFAEYEYDKIRCEARTVVVTRHARVKSPGRKRPIACSECMALFADYPMSTRTPSAEGQVASL